MLPPRSNPGNSTARIALAAVLAAALALAAFVLLGRAQRGPVKAPAIGLFTTLPILWHEGHEIADFLKSDAPPHWAREEVARHGKLRALDTLEALRGVDLLVMAQPRPLSPQENVALDAWVRGGGHVLLFADPLLTGESAYALGDRRRPQDVVLLSPILARWGLRLEFDEGQPPGEHLFELPEGPLPVNLPGRFAALPGGACALAGAGLMADCRVGKGRVLAVADAALFEPAAPADRAARAAMLARLLERAAAR